MTHRPYVILVPQGSRRDDADARWLRTLGPSLQALGIDARLAAVGDAVPEDAIAVCSGAHAGTPPGAQRVVRYVLDKEVASADDSAADFKVYRSKAFPAKKAGRHPVLYQSGVDLAVCHDRGGAERTEDLLWLGAGARFCSEPPPHCTELSDDGPAAREQRAALLRRTRTLYSYDARSVVNLEAILCGAVVVLKHFGSDDGSWAKPDLEATEPGSGGYAYGDNAFERDRARRTRQELVDNLRYQQAIFGRKLLGFVDATQRHFR